MKDVEPLSAELKKAIDEAQWPEPPADLEARLLPGLTSAWTALAADAASAGPMTGVGPSVRHLFGTWGVWSTTAALVVGGFAGALIHRQLTVAPAEVPKVIVSVATPHAEVPARPPVEEAAVVPSRGESFDAGSIRVAAPRRVNAAAPPSTLLAEQRLLDTARTAFMRQQPELGMPVLEDYLLQFPNGRLREEHDALEIQGLCMLNHVAQATKAAGLFRLQFPESVFAESVELSLASLTQLSDGGSDR